MYQNTYIKQISCNSDVQVRGYQKVIRLSNDMAINLKVYTLEIAVNIKTKEIINIVGTQNS